jgi:translation initiation factor 5A
MSDVEDHGHDVEFHDTDAGASTTVPVQAGTIRKGGHIVIKGRPCKVLSAATQFSVVS